ncbi:DNA repair protein RecN [Paenibacillus eucommiae]|uniref:DNA repair protein RecN n=1 Tax=Paenibacillus eucommiae TaxID=1355755 RepID=A0ABS4INE5_9BACL|nr:DNA repair protein RecN [Paenibacillus eucommiae]MBP1989030.1 DNA repair protein RecN (Recombination protein N) [Paenibacillus eucommiae]
MLTELSIRNLAVIEQVHIQFKSGFHVLTGETGAGKSIIIDALSLLIGGRGSSELIRYGCEKAEIEGMFELKADHPVWAALHALGIDSAHDEHLLIRREITSNGKSSSRINGQLVNLSMLRSAGDWLVNIHGQHEHQSLLKVEAHIRWLDLFGEADVISIKKTYQASYDTYTKLQKELRELKETSKQALQMLDLYRFQIEEISSAKLVAGEDEAIFEEKRKLSNAEKLYQNSSEAYDMLYSANQGLDAAGKAIQRLQDIVNLDPVGLQTLLEQMQSGFYQLEDAAYQLRDYKDEVEFNPQRLDEIEHRLDMLSSLRRKYGESIPEILHYLEIITKEMDIIENKDENIQKLEDALKKEEAKLIDAAVKLSAGRERIAKRLASDIEVELRDLQMERTQFVVHLGRAKDDKGIEVDGAKVRFGREGIDQVEFLMAPNPGEPLRGLSKIASGGELSRIMLAMKAIFARIDLIPVLIFDEVDTGVSGRAAQAIAEKMSVLSRSCQVCSITHLPQVACMADAHFAIHKEVDHERTYTKVYDLQGEARIQELARMLGGVEVTETTLGHAREMIALANEKKTRI